MLTLFTGTVRRARSGELAHDHIDAQEGHLTAIANLVRFTRPLPAHPEVKAELLDLRRTALAAWRFEGFVPEQMTHKVPRVFSRDGSVLVFEEWNMAADGVSIAGAPPPR